MDNFWMGLFLGTIILFTILEIKESKRIIRESKHSNKSMTEIAEETADEIEIEKIKILKYVKADKLVYNSIGQRLHNFFRILWVIILVLISLVWAISTI